MTIFPSKNHERTQHHRFLDLSDDLFRRILTFCCESERDERQRRLPVDDAWFVLRSVCQRFHTLQHERILLHLNAEETIQFTKALGYRQRVLSLLLCPSKQLFLSMDRPNKNEVLSFAWLNTLVDSYGCPLYYGLTLPCIEDTRVDLTPLRHVQYLQFDNRNSSSSGNDRSNVFREPCYVHPSEGKDEEEDDSESESGNECRRESAREREEAEDEVTVTAEQRVDDNDEEEEEEEDYDDEDEEDDEEEEDFIEEERRVSRLIPIVPLSREGETVVDKLHVKALQEEQSLLERKREIVENKANTQKNEKKNKNTKKIPPTVVPLTAISFDVLPYLRAAKALRHLSFRHCPVLLDGQTILSELFESRPGSEKVESVSFTHCLGVTHFETLLNAAMDRERTRITASDMIVSPHLSPDRLVRKRAMKRYPIGDSVVLRQTLDACFKRFLRSSPVRYETEREREIVAMGLNLIREEKEVLCCEDAMTCHDSYHELFDPYLERRVPNANHRWFCADDKCSTYVHWVDFCFREVHRLSCDIDTDTRPFKTVAYVAYSDGEKIRTVKTNTNGLIRPQMVPARSGLEVYRLRSLCLSERCGGEGYRSECKAKRNYIFHYDTSTRKWYGKYGGYYVDRCVSCEESEEREMNPLFQKFKIMFLCDDCYNY